MKVYLYDGEFNSLLSLIAYLLSKSIKPKNICDENKYVNNLFDDVINMGSFYSSKIGDELLNKVSNDIKRKVLYVYLSNNERKEIIIYYYLLNVIKYGEVINKYQLRCVNEVENICNSFSKEVDDVFKLSRYQEINDVIYIRIKPVNNVIYILINMYINKYRRKLVIHDVRRKIVSVCYKDKYSVVNEDDFDKNLFLKNDNELLINFINNNFNSKKGVISILPRRYYEVLKKIE